MSVLYLVEDQKYVWVPQNKIYNSIGIVQANIFFFRETLDQIFPELNFRKSKH